MTTGTKYERWFRAREALYPIGHLTSLVTSSSDYVLPPFQREYVWSDEQKIRLIESIWGGVPFGSYVMNYSPTFGKTHGWLIDGQQRWGAIRAYVAGDVPVYGERFPDLSVPLRRKFESFVFPCQLMETDDAAELERVYNLLAYGGTPHVRPVRAATENKEE